MKVYFIQNKDKIGEVIHFLEYRYPVSLLIIENIIGHIEEAMKATLQAKNKKCKEC